MKKIYLLLAVLIIAETAFAQQKRAVISRPMSERVAPCSPRNDDNGLLRQEANPVANTKAVLDDIIGGSDVYDQQTNSSMMQRLYLYPDGTLNAIWMKSDVTGYADRGTGYNYYNGSAWGPAPATRLESVKSGWPTLSRWMGNGEVVFSHRTTTELVMHTRAVKGTGAWTETMAPTSPSTNALVWPSVITNGNNFQNIHLLCMTRTTENGGSLYKGLNGALLYYRSLDGGATWDKHGIQLPGIDSSNYLGFSGDSYNWIEPHGDTIAFVCGGEWVDTFLMVSYDNGNTWTKMPILPNYYCKNPIASATPTFVCSDGSFAGVMDKEGVFHVAYGRMRARDDGTERKYYPGTDGVVYWNSTMGVMDTAIVSSIDTLFAHNLCIGYVAANEFGDTIVDFPAYGIGLSSWPQMTMDEYGNIYFLWSSLTVGNPSPDPYNYRHIWGRAWFKGHSEWSPMIDFNSDLFYVFQEFAYPAISKGIRNGKIQLLTQTSNQPGSAVKDATVPVHHVDLAFREISTADFIPAGIGDKEVSGNTVGQIYPNPVDSKAAINIFLIKPNRVSMTVTNSMGGTVIRTEKGTLPAGSQALQFDCSDLSAGIYLCTLKIGEETFTRKVVIR